MSDVALIVLHIHVNQTMGIGPVEIRDSSRESDCSRQVVRRNTVVREYGVGNDEEPDSQSRKTLLVFFSSTPPVEMLDEEALRTTRGVSRSEAYVNLC